MLKRSKISKDKKKKEGITMKKTKTMNKMQYVMIIKDGIATAKAMGCCSSISMPVSYAFQHMENVTKIGKIEKVAIVWTVVFE